MNTSFERSAKATDEWYTPIHIIDSLGKFDLDPCAPVEPLWETASRMYNKNDNGLEKKMGRPCLAESPLFTTAYRIVFKKNGRTQ